MIGTEEYNNEIMRTNTASMMCDNNKELKFNIFAEEFIKPCSSENIQMGVKGGLKHKKRKDISKSTRRHYHLQTNMFNT